MDKRTGVVVGISSVLAVILAAAVVAVASGGSDQSSVRSGHGQTASSAPVGGSGAAGGSDQPNGGSGGAGASGSGTSSKHSSTTTATTKSATTATTTKSATTATTIHNTIKPIPGRGQPPTIDYNFTSASSASPEASADYPYGVCRGTPPRTTLYLSWTTHNADYVQLNRGAKIYPADDNGVYFPVECDAAHGQGSAPRANVTLTAFGPGGEVSATLGILVDRNYQP